MFLHETSMNIENFIPPRKSFKLSPQSKIIFDDRYKFEENEDWEGLCIRVGQGASIPENGNQKKIQELFSDIIYHQLFVPAGRILRNSGRIAGSLFNCYVLPIGDSIEEIGEYMKKALILWSEGGGVGTNFSPLRPVGSPIKGKGGESSGLVSFLEATDALAGTIESGGSRRAAALACVAVDHPEIINYINSKITDGRLKQFNISVGISNEFIDAVEMDQDWDLKFRNVKYDSVPARELWDLIINNMHKSAEPGILNFSNLFKNNSYYYDPIVSTNPCGEAPLAANGVCDLGSIVLPNFVTNINTNWKKLEFVVKSAVRFLDNIIEMNNYTLHDIDVKAHESRRIGLGVMGLAEYFQIKRIKYGSEKSIHETERLMKFIRDCAYQASIELAIEKGSFPKFESQAYSKSHFVRTLSAPMRLDIKKHGIRNVTCLSIAPTGTLSLLCDTSGGIEPLFSKAYMRNDKIGSRPYIHPTYKKILNNNSEIPEWFVDSYDLAPNEHFAIQVAVQKYVDGAVSKTINIPHDFTKEQLSELTLEYCRDIKGMTIYRDGSREGQVLQKLNHEEVLKILNNDADYDKNQSDHDIRCHNGVCEI